MSAASLPAPVTPRVLDAGRVLAVTFPDGSVARFHAEWLRFNALDAVTRSPGNGQRLLTIGDIPEASTLEDVVTSSDGSAVHLTFEPGAQRSSFPVTWLATHRYDVQRPQASGWTADRVQRWDHATMQDRIPEATLDALRADRRALADWLGAVDRFGVAVVHDVPTTAGALVEVADLFGYVRETNYGRWFDVRSEVNPSNLAYTNLGLQAHTDNPYRDPVPTLQLLACLENTVEGGASTVVDGFACAARLQADDPAGFALLAGHPARFEYAGAADVCLQSKRPVIELGPDGELLAVRFNNRSTAPVVDVPFDEMPAYLAALRRLASYADDPAMHVTFRLAPGDLFIVDNQRVLHARSAFSGSGSRWLQGCYADIDGLRSTLATLRRELAVDGVIDRIVDVFARRGAEEYLGEPVSMAQHMLQSAAAAEADGADPELVVAALLHDIGHFTGELGTYSPDATVDHRHEIEGVRALTGRMPQRVIDCVRLHVAAKRYLCAVEPSYFALLSPASVHTLELQGGPMAADEVAAFEAEPHHADAVRVRRWDEGGKDAGRDVPGLEHHLAALRTLARAALT
ncbi:MAG: TauD/TfdA family dioxygenase [Acidimicrobiaceae bacterium]|nr:TauD/TfdA family dioxygenase [Acidimicrobiaceae bacterium]